MTALLLNAGTGSRMGSLAADKPKCMTTLKGDETILSRQLRLLAGCGVTSFVIATGVYHTIIQQYVAGLNVPAEFIYVRNPRCSETNYIYSMHLAAPHLTGDFLLLHGDLVFSPAVARQVCEHPGSCMAISTTMPLPDKDFKAVLQHGMVRHISVSRFDNAVAAQPFYRLETGDWGRWRGEIDRFCAAGNTGVYAEDALNRVAHTCGISGLDLQDELCCEVDTPQDLEQVRSRL